MGEATATASRPLVVLMSGPPGSGKSTLGRRLGDALRLPVVDKDRLREGFDAIVEYVRAHRWEVAA